jgi:hypothetical protein
LAAARRPVAIAAHIDIDIPSAGSAPAIGINVDFRAPVDSVSVAAPSTDIDVYVGAPVGSAPVTPLSTVGIDVDIGAFLSAGPLIV